VERLSGAPCTSPAGAQALARLEARLFGTEPGRVLVMGSGLSTATHLPGGTILVSGQLVEDFETPEVLAGYILSERVAAGDRDPLLRLLDWTGTGAAFSLLTRGSVPDDRLRDYAEYLLASGQSPVPREALLAAFEAAQIRATPYAYALDISGEATIDLIEADPVPAERARTLLSDGDWVALQGICGG
jgi:hypothetical protein